MTKIPSSQNLKVAIYKGFRLEEGKNRPKIGVVIADFSKIDALLKALYVRFWGIPEGGLKALQIKAFKGGK